MLLRCEELSINLFFIFSFPHRRCFNFWLIKINSSLKSLNVNLRVILDFCWICWKPVSVLSSHLPYYVHLSLWQSAVFLLPTLWPQAISKLLQLLTTHREFTHLALSGCKCCNKPVHKDVLKLLLIIPHGAILSITFIS